MRIINVRNVHAALPEGIRLLQEEGVPRKTRNGTAIMAPFPVATVYSHPWERVLFWPERDANPFLHLYEALWMLGGRRDVLPLTRYTKQFLEYSDDGVRLHDAYGYRWRHWFNFDQLPEIIKMLKDQYDRRAVLQMWDPTTDLNQPERKAVPCNLTITFSRTNTGALDMVVFNRSNDIIWGTYGANAVHFSVLQEYLANEIECPIGTYTQISTNFHAYTNKLDKLPNLPASNGIYSTEKNPYVHGIVAPTFMKAVDPLAIVEELLLCEEHPFEREPGGYGLSWVRIAMCMFRAFHHWRYKAAPERYDLALKELAGDIGPRDPHSCDQNSDWIVAGREWIQRRYDAWTMKMTREGETLGWNV